MFPTDLFGNRIRGKNSFVLNSIYDKPGKHKRKYTKKYADCRQKKGKKK